MASSSVRRRSPTSQTTVPRSFAPSASPGHLLSELPEAVADHRENTCGTRCYVCRLTLTPCCVITVKEPAKLSIITGDPEELVHIDWSEMWTEGEKV